VMLQRINYKGLKGLLWKRRWFILNDDHCLYYFKSPPLRTDTKTINPHDIFLLQSSFIVVEEENNEKDKEKDNFFPFVLRCTLAQYRDTSLSVSALNLFGSDTHAQMGDETMTTVTPKSYSTLFVSKSASNLFSGTTITTSTTPTPVESPQKPAPTTPTTPVESSPQKTAKTVPPRVWRMACQTNRLRTAWITAIKKNMTSTIPNCSSSTTMVE